MGIKEFRNLYFEVGGEMKFEKTWDRIVRFNDKNKNERKIKLIKMTSFRVLKNSIEEVRLKPKETSRYSQP